MSPSFDSIDQIKDMDLHIQRLDIAKDIERKLQHKIDRYDSDRRFRRNCVVVVGLISACGVLAALPFLSEIKLILTVGTSDFRVSVYAIIFALVWIGFPFYFAQQQTKSYRNRTKRGLMFSLAQELNIKYNPSGMFRLGDLYDHLLLPSYDIREVEDGFEGVIGGRRIQFQEATLYSKHQDVERGKWIPGQVMFHGIVLLVPLNKWLEHHTLILSRADVERSAAFNMDTRYLPFKRVNIVSHKFQDRYQIYSTAETEGHYIFDPAFVERFLEIAERIGSKSISASFYKNTLSMMIAFDHDLFEIGNLRIPLDTLSIKHAIDDIALVSDVVEALNMNPHTGL